MTCITVDLGGGVAGILCDRKRRIIVPKCAVCGLSAEYECDFRVKHRKSAERNARVTLVRCDRGTCEPHTIRRGGADLCPVHSDEKYWSA